jgi:energy-coupling factor transporter ATP-binding protein EcfA2
MTEVSVNASEAGLIDDAPRSNPWREDRLGYRNFAERLAKSIVSLRAPHGYVMAVQGPWGSGKSTALNFVKAFLEKYRQENTALATGLRIVDFRPWLVSGHQDVVAAFFKVLGEALQHDQEVRLHKQKQYLRFFGQAADPVLDATATLAALIDPTGGLASRTVAAVAKGSLGKSIERWLSDPSLQAAYEKLSDALGKSAVTILAIIDDIDRLEPEEIRVIMQMVKTLGRLPNVVYLLSYDRRIVDAALQVAVSEKVRQPRYIEKLVQHEIDLPRPPKRSILSILDGEIAQVLGRIDDSYNWYSIVKYGIHSWVQEPRDAVRFANAIKFSWAALTNEIDPQDLIAMEGLRLFEPEVFEWVRRSRDLLFGFGASKEPESENIISRFLDRLPEERQVSLGRLLSTLFPTCSKFFSKNQFAHGEAHFKVAARRGVGCEAGYDAYFTLYPSQDAIPKSQIDFVMESLGDSAAVTETLTGFIDKRSSDGDRLIGDFMDEIGYRFSVAKSLVVPQPFFESLMKIGDVAISINEHLGPLRWSPRFHWHALARETLKRVPAEAAGPMMLESLKNSGSLLAGADIFVELARDHGLISGRDDPRDIQLTKEEITSFGLGVMAMIDQRREAGTLAGLPHYWDVINTWQHFRGSSEPRAWIESNLESEASFVERLSQGFLAYSWGGDEKRRVSVPERPDPELYDLEKLLTAASKYRNSESYSPSEREGVEALCRDLPKFIANPDISRLGRF